METQLDQPTPPNDPALKETTRTPAAKVPLPRPSPTPVPPAYGTTPTSTGAVQCAHSEGVLSPISADLPVSKAQPTAATSTTASSSPPSPPKAAVDVGKESKGDNVACEDAVGVHLDDKMATVRPGFQPYAVTPNTFCPTYPPKVTTVEQPAFTASDNVTSSPPSKCGPLSPEVESLKLGSGEPTIKRVSPTLRVVSPNSVPVKKRSAFRGAETDSAHDRCIQRDVCSALSLQQTNDSQKSENAGKFLPNESSLSTCDQSSLLKDGKETGKPLKDSSQKEKRDSSPSNSIILQMDETSLPPIKRAKLLQENNRSPPMLRQSKDLPGQLDKQQTTSLENRDITESRSEVVVTQSPPSTNATKKEELPSATGSHLNVSSPVGTKPESTSPVQTNYDAVKHLSLKMVETTGGKSNQPGGNNTESSPKAPPSRLLYGPAPPAGYPPLYLPSSCQVTLGRESNRVPKDGSKVHATTFVPDLGEFIPGPASSTREPPSRVVRNGQSGGDGQVAGLKLTESTSVKGTVQPKGGGNKDNKKGNRHAGHVEHTTSKATKKEGKKSPSSSGGDRTISRMVSPSGGSKMVDTKPDRRTDSFGGIDPLKKVRDLGHGVTTKATIGSKTGGGGGDLSIVTHPYGYQPLLSVGGSPPGQKSSSVSPRDKKNNELRAGTEMTSKQRQMLEWHMAAASQHGIFYEATPIWGSPGFGTARTSMITSHSSSVSTQESVLRSALLHGGGGGGGHKQHHDTSSHTTAALTSPKMTVAEATHKVEPVDVTKPKREEVKKPQIGKLNFNDLSSGRGTPSSRTGEGTPTRNPPVGIALVQQRQDMERKSDSRGSTGSNQRDRNDDRRHRDSSRTTFSPHRDSRSTDSHREHRSSSNPSHVSPHNSNLAVTGGSTIGTHAQDYLTHHGPFPSFPACYPRFPGGHHSPSQPLWLHQPYTVPPAHGPTSSSYQDVPLPGNVGLQGRDSMSSRQVMMFPPHLSATEGALHGLGAWPPPYLLPAPLHPQLSSLNPSLYAQFPPLPQGGSSIAQPLHLLSGQSPESHPAVGTELHTILQQHEALYHWYRAAELHSRHGTFPQVSHGDGTHPPSHHGTDRSRKQSGGRKSAEAKSEPDKKQLKSEGQSQETCGRTSREVIEEKVTPSAPSIIPPFLPVPSGPAMPIFYPSHPIPYLLDTTKRPLVPQHSQSPTAKVEKKDAGTSSHSPAGRPSSQESPKEEDTDIKPADSKTACVQTLPTDNLANAKEDPDGTSQEESDVKTVEKKETVTVKTDKADESDETNVVRDHAPPPPKEEELIDVEKLPSSAESTEQGEDPVETQSNEVEEVADEISKDIAKADQTQDMEDPKVTVDKGNQGDGAVDTIHSSDSESWLSSYSSCLDGQRRESLISSIMTTTQSVASRIDAVDQEQLAAIEGIALLSEVAEQKTFEAICNRKDDPPEVTEVDDEVKLKEPASTKEGGDDQEVSCLQPPKDLPVSINTEEMKINQLVELQRRYKEKKKEFDKLQRKKDKKEKSEKSGEPTKKRGPGRPRKRKNSQRGKKTSESSEKREAQPNILQSSADVLLEAAASLEEPAIPTKKRKKDKKEKKSKVKKESDDISRGEMSASSIQSSADVLLEAAASLEQPSIPTKKKKKEKKDKKTKLKRESLGETTLKDVKDSKKKKKKLSKRKEGELSTADNKSKKKTKHSLSSSEITWPSPSLSGLSTSALSKKKLSSKNGEKKKRHSKVKSSLLPSLPEAIDLPAPVGASLPMYGEDKYKLSKGGLSISRVYGDTSDSDESSHCSFDVVPKGLALLASTAELSSGHSTPVKKPSKKSTTKKQSKLKSEETGAKKRSLSEEPGSVTKKLKMSKKKEKGKLQKTLKRERKLVKKSVQKSAAVKEMASNTVSPPKFDAESWSRRRSERIFLSDTSPQQSRDVSPLSKPNDVGKAKMKLNMGGKTKIEPPALSPGLSNIGTVLDALKTDPFQMRKKFSQMSESEEDDDDNEDDDGDVSDSESQNSKIRVKLKGRTSKAKLALLMNEVSAESDSSNSEAEDMDMPLSSLVSDSEPAPRLCNLRKDDLVEGQRVLVPFDNLFYEGKIDPIRPPDVYGVVFESRRGNRPHVYSQEQILQEVIADVKPNSVKYLPEGTRICAYWSQQFNCLYPGTVVKGSPNPSGEKKMVSVEFDDGDSGRIPLSHVRMLPQDYPIVSDLGPSSIPLERRLRQRNTEMGSTQDEIKEEEDARSRRKKISTKTASKLRKKKSLPEVGDDDVFLPNSTPVKSPRGRKPKPKPDASKAKAPVETSPGGPVKKGRGRPRKIRPEETIGQPPKKGRPRKKPLSSNVTMAKKINKFYAGRKKVVQAKSDKPSKGTRPRGRPPGSKKGKKTKAAMSKEKSVFSPEILDPAQAAMLRYNGPDDSEDAGTIGESDIWSQDEEEVTTKKGRGSKGSKIAAFLPERQLWRWLGNATQRKGSKGKAKKVFYKAIVRGKEVIRVNECAVFLSTGRPHLPYVGRIESMWESWGGIMVVRVKWFYHPEETKGCAANIEGKMALYQSSHVDENDIQTISHKCEVLSREEYKLRAMGKIPKNSVIDNEDVYYLAGTYDPTTGRMSTFQ